MLFYVFFAVCSCRLLCSLCFVGAREGEGLVCCCCHHEHYFLCVYVVNIEKPQTRCISHGTIRFNKNHTFGICYARIWHPRAATIWQNIRCDEILFFFSPVFVSRCVYVCLFFSLVFFVPFYCPKNKMKNKSFASKRSLASMYYIGCRPHKC